MHCAAEGNSTAQGQSWVSILNERQNATMYNLEAFYNRYFKADDKIVMMFPKGHEEHMAGMIPAKLCPDCLQVDTNSDGGHDNCPSCGAETIDIFIPSPIHTSGSKDHKQYICPISVLLFCPMRSTSAAHAEVIRPPHYCSGIVAPAFGSSCTV